MEGYSLAIREGFRNFRRARTLSLALAGCIAVAAFAIGAFGLVAANINSALDGWESRVELVAFLERDLSESQSRDVLGQVLANPRVDGAEFVTGRESWEELFPDIRGSLELVEAPIEEVLPATIIVRMLPDSRSVETIRGMASSVASIEGVEEVKFEEVLLERYAALREELALFTAASCVFWVLVFGTIAANIARLASAARQGEVRTLRTLGAGNKFVRRVFMVEGVAQGLAGSTVGIGVLLVAASLISSRTEGAIQLPASVFALAFIVGPVLGMVSSWFLLRTALGTAFALLLVLVPAIGLAQTSLDGEISRHQRDLSHLEDSLKESRDKAKEISEEELAVIDEIERIDRELESLAGEIAIGEGNMAANQAAAETAKRNLEGIEKDLRKSKEELGHWLKLLCNRREPSMVEVILQDIPQSKITLRREIIARLASKEAQALERTNRLYSDFAGRQEELSKRVELDVLYAETTRLRAEQSNEKKKRRAAVLGRLREKKNIYAAVIRDLEVSAERLERLIGNQHKEESAVFADSVPFRDMKGLLPWPTDGEITVSFGRIKNPDSHTFTRHRGLDFAAREGAEIWAVHDASVVYCDWFRGYGKLIILTHDGGYSSVYAHCSQMLVQKGDFVRAGQTIALVGKTGSLKGPFLYFEIRESGTPVDPGEWLQRRNLNATQSE